MRILLACGVVGSLAFLAIGEERPSISVEVGNDKVTRDNTEAIERALRSPTKCDFVDVPLEEAMNRLEKSHKIEIWIDKKSLQDQDTDSNLQVSLEMSGITLESALRLMLEPHGLTHLTEDGVLKITTRVKADEAMSTRVYPVGDLVTVDYEPLMQVVMRTTSGRWLIDDSPDAGTIVDFKDAQCLVIRQTPRIHREIEGLLAALREAKRVQNAKQKPAAF